MFPGKPPWTLVLSLVVQIRRSGGYFLKRSLIVLLLASVCAVAKPITDPVPVISTVCTLDGSPVACDGIAFDPIFFITGLNTAAALYIENDMQIFLSGNFGEEQSVSLDFFAKTDGPVREGFASYTILTEADHGGDTTLHNFASSGFISGLGSESAANSVTSGTMVPFELGKTFEIGLHDSAAIGPGPFQDGLDGVSITTIIELQLFDASGAPVEIFARTVPEPSAWTLFAIGLAAIFVFRARATLTGLRTP